MGRRGPRRACAARVAANRDLHTTPRVPAACPRSTAEPCEVDATGERGRAVEGEGQEETAAALVASQAQLSRAQGDTVPVSSPRGAIDTEFVNELPCVGGIIEMEWDVAGVLKEATGTTASASAAITAEDADHDDSDEDFSPEKLASAAARPAKRQKKKATAARDYMRWWPGIVTDLKITGDRCVYGVVRYTAEVENHGVFPGAGLAFFTGEESHVKFGDKRRDGEPFPELHHLASAQGRRTNTTPWRHFPVSRDKGTPRSHTRDESLSTLSREVRILQEALADVKADILGKQLTNEFSNPGAEAATAPARDILATPVPIRVRHVREDVPAVVKRLQNAGRNRLCSSLITSTTLPQGIRTVCNSGTGDAHGVHAVKGSWIDIPNGFEATLSEFRTLATWFTRSCAGGAPDAGVKIHASERNLWSPSYEESFKLVFQTYGDFCQACDVPLKMRSISVWDEWIAKYRSGRCVIVIGTVKVFSSPAIGPMRQDPDLENLEVERTNTRVVLLGHSWSRLSENRPSDEADIRIPLLRQTDTKMCMEDKDSVNPFTLDLDGANAVSLCEESKRVPTGGEDNFPGFELEWTPLKAVQGIPQSLEDTPGVVSFRIPIVCIRTSTLVESARRLLSLDLCNIPDESDDAKDMRLKLAWEHRMAACQGLRDLSRN